MSVRRAVRAANRRIRVQRAVDGAVRLGLVALVGAAFVLLGLRTGLLEPYPSAMPYLAAMAGLPLLGSGLGYLRRVPPLMAAHLLDRAHGLHDRLASALWFAQLSAEERTPFAEACMADAARHAAHVRPNRAVPLRLPRGWPLAMVMALGVVALALVEWPQRPSAKTVAPPPLPPRLLHHDDIDALKDDLGKPERGGMPSPATTREAREFNQLLEQIAERQLNRTQALLKISQLDKRLVNAYPMELDAVERALREAGRKLGAAPITSSLAKALKEADALGASRALEQLSEKLGRRELRARTARQLARGLGRSALASDGRLSRQLARMRREIQRLLERKSRDGKLNRADARLLDRRREQLEQLQRRQELAEPQGRQLEQLRRQLQQAAESLQARRSQDAARHLQKGAEALNRIVKEQRLARENRKLRERLAQLRELVRRTGLRARQGKPSHGGGDREVEMLSLDRFAGMARGRRTGDKRLQKDRGQRSRQAHLLEPWGKQGAKAVMELPGAALSKHSQDIDMPAPNGAEPGKAKATGEHAKPTQLDSTRVDAHAQGRQGAGPTRSEVILASADRGFVSSGYRKVFADYKNHAESVVERDEIPDGYRFYVRRYFQLIRPRENR